MNKVEIAHILKDSIAFTISTATYKSPELNKHKVSFIGDNILELVVSHGEYMYINVKDVKNVRVIK